MSSAAVKRAQRELGELRANPLTNIEVETEGDNLLLWNVTMIGPTGPYEGGKFRLKIKFGYDFPFKAPSLKFATKMYHPNIDSDGNICIGVLKAEAWKPSTKMASVLLSLYDLVENPNPDDPLVTSIAEQYATDRPAFNKKAAEYTKMYAI
ncbi:hypothetical protein CcaverHIS641_0406220 [Cutaneotrichosporon cavernicola]|nr:hypothetical protein CcaverHIS641_0406220 [Cutaneotrichosporon cavernicola]